MDMRIVETGDRSWQCDELATAILRRLFQRYGPNLTIVHGGQNGVDESFNKACKNLEIAVEVRLANWPQTGHPMIGNKNRELIKDGADLCIALHRSISRSERTSIAELQSGSPTSTNAAQK
jgi:hypothetical protein